MDMETKPYVPAIIAKYRRQHNADEKRIKKAVKVSLDLSDELDSLVNGFVYGGHK